MADDTTAPAADAYAALASLKSALDAHLAAVEARAGENDPKVQAAYDALAAAAERYDDALFAAFEEVTPFGPVESEDMDDEDDDLEWETDET